MVRGCLKTKDTLRAYGIVMHLLFSFFQFFMFFLDKSIGENFIDTIIKHFVWVSITMKFVIQYRKYLMK